MVKKKFIEFIKDKRSEWVFDPAVLNDSIALQTEWNSNSSSSSNFKTHKLVYKNPNRYEFKPTVASKVFSAIFMIVGIAVPVLFLNLPADSGEEAPVWALVGFGAIFFAVGAAMHYYQSKPIVFDKLEGFYWKGRQKPDHTFGLEDSKNICRIRNIHAIQVLKKFVSGNKSSYHCYEINLVLKNGSRLHVVAHAGEKAMKDHAAELARFLGVPVWDAS